MSESGIVKEGNLKFVYSERENLETIRSYLGWDFENSKVTKELNLTHNLIASKAGFKSLMEIYNNDSIIDFKNKIRKYIKDNNISDDFSELTFGEVIIFLQRSKTGRELNRVSPTPNMLEFFTQNIELYEFAKSLKWEIFSKYYVDKDQLLDDKKQDSEDENKKGSNRDNLIKHLFKIQNSIYLYASKQFNEFLHRTEKKIYTIQDKIDLKQSIEDLINVGDKTVEQVVDLAHEKGVCIKDEKLNNFINDKEYIYNRVKLIPFKEFQKLYDFLEGFTPFSTKHKTKGAEFDNVLVILDNGRWNKYNFENLFIGGGSESVLDRTQKIFYVCCTRSKENLAVFYHKPSQAVISKAKQWFGELNVIDIDDLILE
jgi:DNA helicase-2/ATP-dependent DNA helicase PcrA